MKVNKIRLPNRPNGETNHHITIIRGKLQDLDRDTGNPRGPLIGADILIATQRTIPKAMIMAKNYEIASKHHGSVTTQLAGVYAEIKQLHDQLEILELRKKDLLRIQDIHCKDTHRIRENMDRLGFRTADIDEQGYDVCFLPWYVSIGCKKVKYPQAVAFIKKLLRMLKQSKGGKS